MIITISNLYASHTVVTDMTKEVWEDNLKQVVSGDSNFITVKDIRNGRIITICPSNCSVIEVEE